MDDKKTRLPHRLLREVFFMCRQNQLRGMLLLGFGLGLLAGCWVGSTFWCCLLGVGASMAGILCVLKR